MRWHGRRVGPGGQRERAGEDRLLLESQFRAEHMSTELHLLKVGLRV